MQSTQLPTKMPVPWANAAAASYLRQPPTASQISTDPNAASYTDGFPPNTFVDPASGGKWPDGRDFNGVLQQITTWLRWLQAGGFPVYDSAFSTAISGYPKGAMLASTVVPGTFWVSTTEGNTNNPDTNTTGWTTFAAQIHTWTAAQTFATSPILNNNVPLNAKNVAGAVQQIIGLLSDNITHIVGGPSGLVMTDQTGTISLYTVGPAGNATLKGALTCTGLQVNGAAGITGTLTCSGNFNLSGSATISGNMQCAAATFIGPRAGVLARGVNTSDFQTAYNGVQNIKRTDPDGYIRMRFSLAINIGNPNAPSVGVYTMPWTFPNTHAAAMCQWLGSSPPGPGNPGSIAAQPYSTSQVQITTYYAGSGTSLGIAVFCEGN